MRHVRHEDAGSPDAFAEYMVGEVLMDLRKHGGAVSTDGETLMYKTAGPTGRNLRCALYMAKYQIIDAILRESLM